MVEDNSHIRDSLRTSLTAAGQSVVEAASIPEAIALINGLPEISLILSDLQLEGDATGLDLAHVPTDASLIYMTSLPVSHPLRQEATRHATVLSKPINDATLQALLQKEHLE